MPCTCRLFITVVSIARRAVAMAQSVPSVGRSTQTESGQRKFTRRSFLFIGTLNLERATLTEALRRRQSNMEWPEGEGPPPRGPQHHMVRGNADDTEVVPPS